MSQWPMTELGELISFRGGGTPSKDKPEYWGDDISWATVKDFKGLYLDKTQDSISEQGLKSSSANLIPAGHVIIPTRMALGKAAINTIDLAINQDLRALLPQKPLDTKYLLHAVLGLSDQIEANGSGATVKGITQEKLKKLRVPYPPLEEQKRIAKILDAADALRAKRRESLAQLDALLQSTFLDLFGDPKRNFNGWKESSLDNLADFYAGNSLPDVEVYQEGVSAFLALKVSDLNLPGNEEVISYSQYGTKAKLRGAVYCPKDSVVFPKRGGAIGTNKKRLLSREACLDPNLMAVSPRDERILPIFLFHWFKQFNLSDIASGSSVPQLNKRDLAPLILSVPPLELQERFGRIAKCIGQQKDVASRHLEDASELFYSLQKRAFLGEL